MGADIGRIEDPLHLGQYLLLPLSSQEVAVVSEDWVEEVVLCKGISKVVDLADLLGREFGLFS